MLEKYAETGDSVLSVAVLQVLVTSGNLAFSIFRTSAPNSAKNIPTDGPANTVDASIIFKDEIMRVNVVIFEGFVFVFKHK